ncbi:hypothetical protein AMTR_s00037p00224900 [Amborella trichopoda]|uniref:Uncharacterized protein n=1 Tax=Amborella trichopoda TaxID=13333 RepID=U5D5A5_AMBTC|nr:hypothetical protein AMTR_s00037p00224900 [Amborella trichopoda]
MIFFILIRSICDPLPRSTMLSAPVTRIPSQVRSAFATRTIGSQLMRPLPSSSTPRLSLMSPEPSKLLSLLVSLLTPDETTVVFIYDDYEFERLPLLC